MNHLFKKAKTHIFEKKCVFDENCFGPINPRQMLSSTSIRKPIAKTHFQKLTFQGKKFESAK